MANSWRCSLIMLLMGAVLVLPSCGQYMMSRALNNFDDSYKNRLQLTNESLKSAKVNVPYQGKVQAVGGMPPYKWEVIEGTLPQGLTLVSSSGVLAGVPVEVGQRTVVIQVKDGSNDPSRGSVIRTFVLDVE